METIEENEKSNKILKRQLTIATLVFALITAKSIKTEFVNEKLKEQNEKLSQYTQVLEEYTTALEESIPLLCKKSYLEGKKSVLSPSKVQNNYQVNSNDNFHILTEEQQFENNKKIITEFLKISEGENNTQKPHQKVKHLTIN